jgi:hypothetical protein
MNFELQPDEENFELETQTVQTPEPINMEIKPISDVKNLNSTFFKIISEGGFGFFQLFMFVFCGLSWGTADATEIMLLSYLGPSITEYWDLQDYHRAILNSVVFIVNF